MLSRALTLPTPRRSGSSRSVVMASRYVEHQVFILRNHGVLVNAVDLHHSASPILVGKAIEEELGIQPHSLRVTHHHPEAFYIHFDFPAHRDRAVALGRLIVNDSAFILQPWRELDHGSVERFNLHVRVVIEKMPLHLWSIEGAESVLGKDVIVDRLDSRTYAKEDTQLFSCWVWCWSLDSIPSDHVFTIFRNGAGRVEEMNGYSPPRRAVAPPPEGITFTALIHIDLAEDWTVRESRTPSSRQSGMPSSSSEEVPPVPAIQQYTWFMRCRDGEEPRSGARRRLLGPCRDFFTSTRRDDADDDADDRRGPGRGLGSPRALPPRTVISALHDQGGSRRRCRTPVRQRRRAASPPHQLNVVVLPPPPPLPSDGTLPLRLVSMPAEVEVPVVPTPPLSPPAPETALSPTSPDSYFSASSEDPLAELMAAERLDDFVSVQDSVDPMEFELNAFCNKIVASPLMFSPTGGLGRAPYSPSLLSRASPPPSPAVDVDSEATDGALRALFAAPPTSILGASPPTPSPIAKEKPQFTPRRSARQAGKPSATPVAQRATARLAKELAVVELGDLHPDSAATTLVQRFKEPLREVDVDGLAVLTRIDRDALHRAAARASATRAATPAH
ncbi:hypothetical protein BRADI_5g08877v3 [Brachypodium distachyon]|uniref:DUF4283 domain-containing protein n=1 Tax=Brachypodium distachyon TaxID=15368 RepID=A0A0Q3E440_BRADI|nr:hypothetical protein BRADI_5g08877v3 [Brachypodium distachyon]